MSVSAEEDDVGNVVDEIHELVPLVQVPGPGVCEEEDTALAQWRTINDTRKTHRDDRRVSPRDW